MRFIKTKLYCFSGAELHILRGRASRIGHRGPHVIIVQPRGLLGSIRGAVWKMSFERGYSLNKDVCLGLSTKSDVEAQYVVWVWWNARRSFTLGSTYSAPLYSSRQFDLVQASSSHPCCATPCLFQQSHQGTYNLFYSFHGSGWDAHFICYHLSFSPTMASLPAMWFSLPSLVSIFPTSYLWKWQCYLQTLSSGSTDRENGSGDDIGLGHGLWRMAGCV